MTNFELVEDGKTFASGVCPPRSSTARRRSAWSKAMQFAARAVFPPLESNLTLVGLGYFQRTKMLQRVRF
jgi:hypothetical protein